MKKVYFLSAVLIFSLLRSASAYIWPTNAPELLSGTFGERRSGHFHSGIDVKTWAQSGYECYAVGDGYISRIRETPGGYGKVLYLELDDGRTAVYSHLLKFTGSLEKTAHSIKYRKRTNLLEKEFAVNEIRVREGNLIAYTGGSGTRWPHLHFELRDAENRPLNPLKYGFEIKDEMAPEPRQIAISPADIDSKVMGLNTYSVFPLEFFRNGIYECPDTIQAKGRIEVNVQAYDQSASGNNNGVYQMVLYHQGKKRFSKEFDSFSFEETDMILLDRDYRLGAHGLGDFHALYSRDVNRYFSAYDSTLNGILKVQPGYQTIVIQLRDVQGNRSSVRFTVYGGDYPDHQFSSREGDSFFIIDTDSLLQKEKIRQLRLRKYNPYGYPLDEKRIDPETDLKNGKFMLPLRDLQSSLLTLQYTDSLGYESYPQLFHFNGHTQASGNRINIRTHQYLDRVLLEIHSESPLSHEMILALEKDGFESIDLKRISMHSLISRPLSMDEMKDVKAFAVYERNATEWQHRRKLQSFIAWRGEKLQWMSPDSSLAIIIPRQAFYQDAFVHFEEVPRPADPEGGEILSRAYHFYPDDIPARQGISIAFRFRNKFPLTKDIGIYAYNEFKNEWNPLRAKAAAPERSYIDAKGVSGAVLAVIRDMEAPRLVSSYPGRGGSYRQKDINKNGLRFEIADSLSGFGSGEGIKILVDGEWKVFYYNAVTKVVTVDDPGLKTGTHYLDIELEDSAGNRMKERIHFNVI